MCYFSYVKKYLDNMGIYRSQAFENHSFNLKNFSFLVILAQNFVFTVLYLLFKAHTFSEYFESFYYIAVLMINFAYVVEFVRKTTKIYDLIEKFKRIVKEGKYQKKKSLLIGGIFSLCALL